MEGLTEGRKAKKEMERTEELRAELLRSRQWMN